jgi:hypothetical protein
MALMEAQHARFDASLLEALGHPTAYGGGGAEDAAHHTHDGSHMMVEVA